MPNKVFLIQHGVPHILDEETNILGSTCTAYRDRPQGPGQRGMGEAGGEMPRIALLL